MIEGIFGRAQAFQFLFIKFDFGFQKRQLFGQGLDIPDVFKHHLAVDGNNPAVFFNGDPLDHHVLSFDAMRMIDLRDTGLGYHIHPGIFHHLAAMFADDLLGINPQEVAIGPAEKNDPALGIGDHHPVADVIEHPFVKINFFLQLLNNSGRHRGGLSD